MFSYAFASVKNDGYEFSVTGFCHNFKCKNWVGTCFILYHAQVDGFVVYVPIRVRMNGSRGFGQ